MANTEQERGFNTGRPAEVIVYTLRDALGQDPRLTIRERDPRHVSGEMLRVRRTRSNKPRGDR
jgi:hypothetical protein